MLLNVIKALAILAIKPTVINAPIVAASIFRNGYSVVLRDIPVSGAGEYELESLPMTSYGTLWFSTVGGVKLDAVNTESEETAPMSVGYTHISEILMANIGKEVTLGLTKGDDLTGTTRKGKLLSATGGLAVLDTGKGSIAIPMDWINSVASEGAPLNYEHNVSGVRLKHLLFRTSGGAGSIQVLSMEQGITWTPSYAIDVLSADRLRITAKCTIENNLEDLNDVGARLVSGFPHVPYAATQDPLTAGLALSRYLQGLSSNVTHQAVVTGHLQAITSASGAKPPELFNNDAASQIVGYLPGPGQELEDLYFYEHPGLTLKNGEASYNVIMETEAPYEDLYTLVLSDTVLNNVLFDPHRTGSPEVWHCLEFTDTSDQPLASGVATVVKNGQIVGQDMMSYASAHGKAELRVSMASDVHVEATEGEVSRVRNSLWWDFAGASVDLVTVKGTIHVTNSEARAIKLKTRKSITGELIVASGGAKSQKTDKGLRDVNPGGEIEWNLSLAPGEQKTLTYTYKLYVDPRYASAQGRGSPPPSLG